jgi:SAM-dependent methyltransferase
MLWPVTGPLPTVDAPCVLCGANEANALWTTRDRAFAVPGAFTVARCRGCGFLYQRPRVRDEHLPDCYPDHYPRHQEPSPRVPFRGSSARRRAVGWALASGLGYARLQDAQPPGALTRLRARWLLRRLRWSCPPWVGQGRYLDVGCGSGASLGVARALGWQVAGIEMDAVAADKARRFSERVWTGDALGAPFAPGGFDLVTAFHVLEHVPDPVRLLRRMLEWLAPGGLLVIEVPNAGGLGARLFGPAWSGLELPRHLSHFTPTTLTRAVERAGGRVVWCRHQAKPRHYLWSLQIALREAGLSWLARATSRPPLYGLLKVGLEATLPLAGWAGRGEVVRIGVVYSSGRGREPC